MPKGVPDQQTIVTVPVAIEDNFSPSDVERKVVADVFKKYRMAVQERNKVYSFFDGRNLIQYINDSARRFTTNVDERDDIEDWQARIHDPFTNNKVNAILGKVVGVLPIASFTARGDEDVIKSSIINDLYEFSEEVDGYEENMMHILLESIVKGTAVVYEGMQRHTRLLREIKGIGDDITISENSEVTTKLYSELVPLEEFYPSHVRTRRIADMPYCFWRNEMYYEEFIQHWGDYAKSRYVKPWGGITSNADQKPFYADYVSSETQLGNVEVIRFYDQERDQYVILANGVWLNPIVTAKGVTEFVSPLPFNHKKLPFWSVKFAIIGDWFYGKSLPDKLKNLQDVLNVLTNMMLDQSFLTIFPPMLTNGYDSIEDDYLRPGRRTPIDTQGLPIQQAFMKLDIGVPTSWHQYILEYTRRIMEEASVDKVSQGVAGGGDRTTAQEIRVAAEAVASFLGLFGRLINHGLKDKARIRAQNILQFWFDPKTPYLQGILGDGREEEVNKAFSTFKMDNVALSGGKRGTRIIELYANKAKMPNQASVKARAAVASASTGKNIEIVAVEPTYIRNIDFDVKMVINERTEQSKELRQAMQLEKVRVYMTFFPNAINLNELAAQTATVMGDDPTKILNEGVFQPQPAMTGPETAQPSATQPTTNTAQNTVASAAGGQVGPQQLGTINKLGDLGSMLG